MRPEAIRIDCRPIGSGAKISPFSTSSIDSFGRSLHAPAAQLLDQATRHINAVEEVDDEIVRLRGFDRQAQRGLFVELDHIAQTFRAKRLRDDRGDLAGSTAAKIRVLPNQHAIERFGDDARRVSYVAVAPVAR